MLDMRHIHEILLGRAVNCSVMYKSCVTVNNHVGRGGPVLEINLCLVAKCA